MKKTIDEVFFEIKEVSDVNNGKKYRVEINIPEKMGWIDDVNLVITNSNIKYPLSFEKKENGVVTFSGDVILNTRAIYNYFFSYTADGQNYYVKNKTNNIDAFKMSVNFETPKWANGAVMYHVL